jgi:hypothetical protein
MSGCLSIMLNMKLINANSVVDIKNEQRNVGYDPK